MKPKRSGRFARRAGSAIAALALLLPGCGQGNTEVVRAAFHAGADLGYKAATNGITLHDAHLIIDRSFEQEAWK